MKKVVLIIPYFGELPRIFDIWKKTAGCNPEIDFFIYTDITISDVSKNIFVKYITFEELRHKIRASIPAAKNIKRPYKLCDYRPAFGMLFSEDIKNYAYWGYCDIDLVFGNIKHFITEYLDAEYDHINCCGHFTLFKNCPQMNELYLRKIPNVLDYEHTFRLDYLCHFDEGGDG